MPDDTGLYRAHGALIAQLRADLAAREQELEQAQTAGKALAIAAAEALVHTLELEDAWQRGVMRESDHYRMGGTRSNRNVQARVSLHKALDAAPARWKE